MYQSIKYHVYVDPQKTAGKETALDIFSNMFHGSNLDHTDRNFHPSRNHQEPDKLSRSDSAYG